MICSRKFSRSMSLFLSDIQAPSHSLFISLSLSLFLSSFRKFSFLCWLWFLAHSPSLFCAFCYIVKIYWTFMSFFICNHLYHFFPVSIHSLQCNHCLLQLYVTRVYSVETMSHLQGVNVESWHVGCESCNWTEVQWMCNMDQSPRQSSHGHEKNKTFSIHARWDSNQYPFE